jgi:predicted HTH transcriptional regulator
MGKLLHDRILEGEHLHQDFKFAISDSKKIARSLVAFANTAGGSLLIGVKDNGNIAGVSSDEEYYMIEAASGMYCQPPVPFTTKEWNVNGKTVLEVMVKKSTHRPHKAPDKDGHYQAYVRVDDKNLVANRILLKVWTRESRGQNTLIRFQAAEKKLFDYLQHNEHISFTKFRKLAHLPAYKAEKILVNLLSMQVLEMVLTEKTTLYRLNETELTKLDVPE